MGYFSRLPNDNDPPTVNSNPRSPNNSLTDEIADLLNFKALRCCHCRRVIAKQHIVIQHSHAFCSNCQKLSCTTSGECQYNIELFLEHNDSGRRVFVYEGGIDDREAD